MPTHDRAPSEGLWAAPFWPHHPRRSSIRLRAIADRGELDAWLAAQVTPALGPPQPVSLTQIRERVEVEPDHWLGEGDDHQPCAAALRLTGQTLPSLLLLFACHRPRLKAVEDCLIDLTDHHLPPTPVTGRLRLHLLRRDGWVLPVARDLGFQISQEAQIPERGTAMIEINRHTIDGLNRPGAL